MGGRDALISAVTTVEVIEATRARERLASRSTMCSPRRIKRGNHSRCKRSDGASEGGSECDIGSLEDNASHLF